MAPCHPGPTHLPEDVGAVCPHRRLIKNAATEVATFSGEQIKFVKKFNSHGNYTSVEITCIGLCGGCLVEMMAIN